ncbi:SCO family protein [Microvirga terrae]|uniref:SCO family protein n=1 Tax=Microvirga terrae TaxID=2740529 RepID=A0ABY5RRC2_9HYPH|nr:MULTISPECIES: SCO family protein [Microvirga]MBQ0822522.1 SCO family protein [Microvirga sp. HBU67558]UVF19816.1 SCO family protein [Microvirga terrae]
MTIKRLLVPLLVFTTGLLVLLVTAGLLLFPSQPPQSAGKVPIGGPFRLTSHEGRPYTEENLKGKPFVVFFGFTHCPEVCPTTLYDLTQDMAALGPDADRLQAAFITVDPARDTPELMKTYLSSFDPRIVGLSGTEEEIAAAARAYKIYYRKVPTDDGYTMDHSATLFLMDSKGEFYGTSNFQEPEETRRAKLRQLIKNG